MKGTFTVKAAAIDRDARAGKQAFVSHGLRRLPRARRPPGRSGTVGPNLDRSTASQAAIVIVDRERARGRWQAYRGQADLARRSQDVATLHRRVSHRLGGRSHPEPLEHRLVAPPLRRRLHLQLRGRSCGRGAARSRAAPRGRSRAPSSRPCRSGSASGSRSRCRGARGRAPSSISTTSAVTACGTSSFVSRSACSRTSSAIRASSGMSVTSPVRVVERPLGEQRDEVVAELVDPVAGLRAHRVERVEVAERRGGLHLRRDVRGFSRSTLLSDDHDRHAELEDAPRDEPVAGADPLARVDDEQHDVEVVAHRLVDASPASARSAGRSAAASRAGRRARAARRRSCATPRMRWRVVCGIARDDRDLLAGERVHERRLADVRPPGDGDEAGPHSGSSHVSGSSSPGVVGADLAVVAAVADLADPELVQPLPAAAARRRGDPDRLEVARAVAGRDRGRDRRLLGADPERVRGVLDVHALELAPVARPHDRADEVVRVRRVRLRGRRLRLLDEVAAHASWKSDEGR